jgi:hypothetical protein
MCWLIKLSLHTCFFLVCSIPFLLARLRGVNPRIDRFMDSAGRWMHADPPSIYKGSKQPASKQFLRSLKSTQYVGPADVEAAAEGGLWRSDQPSMCLV